MRHTSLIFPGLTVLAIVIGEVFDHTEWRYGWPRRVFVLRWNRVGIVLGLLIVLVYGIGFARR